MRTGAALLDLLLPPACLGCGGWLVDRVPERKEVLCGPCALRLSPPPPPRCPRCDLPLGTGHSPGRPCPECGGWDPDLDGALTATVLEGPASRLVHALKYDGWRRAALPMARSMARRVTPLPGTVLVPVPTTPARIRARGYNQASLLARALSGLLDLPVVEGLVRPGSGTSQVALHASQRRSNVRDAFRWSDDHGDLRGAPVLLVDDVLTTGATAGAAARVLRDRGAGTVTLLAFARALPGRA